MVTMAQFVISCLCSRIFFTLFVHNGSFFIPLECFIKARKTTNAIAARRRPQAEVNHNVSRASDVDHKISVTALSL